METRFLVIGCGPTGLGAAYKLRDMGIDDYLVLEQAPYPGGLATSFIDDNGFCWDIGGHDQLSHYKYFDDAMLAAIPEEQWCEHQRESWIWIKDRFVPYPFQNNLRYLPRDCLMECLRGVLQAWKSESVDSPAHLRDWILKVFGEGIAREFMLPFNYKVWGFQPEDLAYQWIGEHVAVTDIERILENVVFEKVDSSWGPNNTFRFPEFGGTGAIWKSLARIVGMDKIELGCKVMEIDPERRCAHLGDGRTIAYEHVLSTIPLVELTKMTKGVANSVVNATSRLRHSASNIVGIGLQGRPPTDIESKCWMYFPEENCPFYRVTVFSNYSPRNVPDSDNYYSLMTETSESTEKAVNHGRLVQDTIDGLRATKLIRPQDKIVSRWYHRAAFGYPTPTIDRDAILDQVIPHLDSMHVYSRGRFGGWKYEVSNQDHSFMQGVEWADWIVNGVPESTYGVSRNDDAVTRSARIRRLPSGDWASMGARERHSRGSSSVRTKH